MASNQHRKQENTFENDSQKQGIRPEEIKKGVKYSVVKVLLLYYTYPKITN